MFQKIKDYALGVLLILLGVAAYMLGQRGNKIKDLQDNLAEQSLKDALRTLETKAGGDQKAYEKSRDDFISKRDRYNNLFRPK